MKLVLTGYGKMGRMIEEEAQKRGWEVLAALDGPDLGRLETLLGADLVIDFSHPDTLGPL